MTAAHLRDDVNLDVLTCRLVEVGKRAMQPASVSVYLPLAAAVELIERHAAHFKQRQQAGAHA